MDTPHELVGAFATAVELTLREMAGAGATRDAAGAWSADVSAAIRLDGGASWWAALGLPSETAMALARRVLAGAGVEPDEGMVRDCLAEVLNVVAGQAKTLLYGTPYHFTFTTPTARPAGLAAGAEVGFRSECGSFALRLCPAAGGGSPVTGSEG